MDIQLQQRIIARLQSIAESDKVLTEREDFEMRRMYMILLQAAIDDAEVYLATAFSKLSYLASLRSWNYKDKYLSHTYRRLAEGKAPDHERSTRDLALYCCSYLFSQVADEDPPPLEQRDRLYEGYRDSTSTDQYLGSKHVQLLAEDEEGLFLITDESKPELELRMDLRHTSQSTALEHLAERLRTHLRPPIELYLQDIALTDDDVYIPQIVVVAPDYLINVTSVASCYGAGKPQPDTYLISRFLPHLPNKYLLLGDIANHMLDKLCHEPSVEFDDLFRETFQRHALHYTYMPDDELKQLHADARNQYDNLLHVITKQFPTVGIMLAHCQVEPSFYSDKYGLQGRLDLLAIDPRRSSLPIIVELKSGKPFMPNTYGIGNSHYIQTLLYDLLLKSVSNQKYRPRNFILYSKLVDKALRSAPSIKAQQTEALDLRNELYLIDHQLQVDSPSEMLLDATCDEHMQHLTGFTKTNAIAVRKRLLPLSPLERDYFDAYCSFVAREEYLTRLGETHSLRRAGMNSLWQDSIEEKVERFEIFAYLQILDTTLTGDDHIINLRRSERSNDLANFRTGDIAVLYPVTHAVDSAVRNQILKGTVLEVSDDIIRFRLRHPQLFDKYFSQHEYWNLEPDTLSSSYRRMYQGLYQWAGLPENQRRMLLGLERPRVAQLQHHVWPDRLTKTQCEVLDQLVRTQDYALIWGPPGTGKTSAILKNYLRYLLEEKDETVMLIAYTNRAVDEMCAVLEILDVDYLRIGSRYSTGAPYRDRLLQAQVAQLDSRSQVRDLLAHKPVIIGTLASIAGKPELTMLKTFDTLIVDEASQILEPALIGLLGLFKKWVLIGDHYQLPAVVRQDRKQALVRSEKLLEVGIRNSADSLFERLYHQAEKHGYPCVHRLTEQGRMHEDIVEFPAVAFYSKQLTCLEGSERLTAKLPKMNWRQDVLSKRVAFIPVIAAEDELMTKYNTREADLAVSLASELVEAGAHHPSEIAVICPFRAQVALVMSKMDASEINLDGLLVDTVERLQGGARDVIIISLTVHRSDQLAHMISMNADETVDRKLNVALTRARERLYVLGDTSILSQSPIYRLLIDSIG